MKLASGPNLAQNLPSIDHLKLSDIARDLGGTNAKHDGKSLRLIFKKVGTTSETATLKVHTSWSNKLRSAGERDMKRLQARGHVKEALMREYNLDSKSADRLMSKVCAGTDRITLSELKALSKEAVVLQNTKDMLSLLKSGERFDSYDHIMRKAGETLNFSEVPEIKDLCFRIANAPDKGTFKQALSELNNLMKPVYSTTAFLEMHPLPKEGVQRPKDFGTMSNNLQKAIKSELRQLMNDAVGSFLKANVHKTPPFNFGDKKVPVPEEDIKQFNEGTFDDLLKLDKKNWSVSSQGATGSLVVKDSSLPGNGALVKFELNHVGKSCNDISEYIEHLQKNVDLPIDGMKVKSLTTDEKSQESMRNIINQSGDERAINLTKPKFEGVVKGGSMVVKAMFLQGTSDISSFSVPERLQLARNSQFAQSLGNVMILGTLFGLGDHVGIGGQPYEGKTNFSNLMLNKENGRLALIDYAYHDGGRSINKEDKSTYFEVQNDKNTDVKPLSGFSAENLKTGFSLVSKFVKDISENPGKLDQLFNDDGQVNLEMAGAMTSILTASFGTGTEGCLFHDSEQEALKFFTPEDRKKFVLNVCLGTIDSLMLVAKNEKAFSGRESAVEDPQLEIDHQVVDPMFDNPGKVISDVKTLTQDLGPVREKIANMLK